MCGDRYFSSVWKEVASSVEQFRDCDVKCSRSDEMMVDDGLFSIMFPLCITPHLAVDQDVVQTIFSTSN